MALTQATELADFTSGIGTAGAILEVDNVNNKIGIGTTNPQAMLQVGQIIKMDGPSGIVTATTFSGNFTGNITGNATGLSGTPNITVNNIIGVAATFTGQVTYEDVTNIDSIGIITARSDISIADKIIHTGDTNTAIRFPSGDTFTVETSGVERLRVGSTGTVGVAGLSTATSFGAFNHLSAPFGGGTVTYTVTVASKTADHRYNGSGSSNAYLIDGVQSPFLTLTPGRTYRFVHDNTGSHPLKFYLEADKTTNYTTGVTFDNAYTEIVVSDSTPQVLHYQCTNHSLMGNAVQTNSNIGGGFNVADESSDTSCNVLFTTAATGTALAAKSGTNLTFNSSSGALTATSFVGSGANLTGVISGVELQQGGSSVGTSITAINFSGATVSAPDSVGLSTVTVTSIPTQITVADESSDTTCFPVFVTAATGDLGPKSGTNLTFNSSSGALTATSFAGDGSSLTSLSGSNISSGTVAAARVATLNQNTTGTSGGLTGTPNISCGTGAFSGSVTLVATAPQINFTAGGSAVAQAGQILVGENGGGGDLLLKTKTTGGTLTTRLTVGNDGTVNLPDNGKFTAGAGDDLEIYHDGTDSHIDNNTGDLNITTTGSGDDIYLTAVDDIYIRVAGGENAIVCSDNGNVALYHNNVEVIQTTGSGLLVKGPEGGAAILEMYADEGDDNADKYRFHVTDGSPMRIQNFGTGGWATNILLNSNGSVELYNAGSKKLETTSSGVTVTGDLNSTSDINLKKDIEVVSSATEMVNQLRGVKFTWKENDEKSVGVIAQEVEDILPELVKGEEGEKSVNYSGLVGVLIESVKELTEEVNALKSQLNK